MVYGRIVKCQISYLRKNRDARDLRNDVRTIISNVHHSVNPLRLDFKSCRIQKCDDASLLGLYSLYSLLSMTFFARALLPW